jgi:hypothetical protein
MYIHIIQICLLISFINRKKNIIQFMNDIFYMINMFIINGLWFF